MGNVKRAVGRQRRERAAMASSTYTRAVGAIARQKNAASFFPPTCLKLHEAKETVMWWQRPDYHNAGVTLLPPNTLLLVVFRNSEPSKQGSAHTAQSGFKCCVSRATHSSSAGRNALSVGGNMCFSSTCSFVSLSLLPPE